MKICIVSRGTPRIPPKPNIPVTIYLHTLAEHLVKLGHEVDVICPPTPGYEKQIYNLVEVGHPYIASRNQIIQNLYEIWFGLCFALRLRGLCRKRNYDVVHFFENPVPACAALLFDKHDHHRFLFSSGMAVSGTKLVWGVHDKASFIWRASMFFHEQVFRRMPRISVSSARLKEVVVALAGVEAGKIGIAPFVAAETDFFQSGADTAGLRQTLGLATDDMVVLCLAPVAPYKNQLSVVKAIPSVIREHPKARFVFVGEFSAREYYALIQQFVHDNALESHSLFTGFIRSYADLPKYYNLADVYILPSFAEGLPKVLLEAMSCGRAVIASHIPQNREAAKKGDEILFVNPEDPSDIASAINTLLADPELRQKMGEWARQTIINHFSPEVIARGIIEVYQQILTQKPDL